MSDTGMAGPLAHIDGSRGHSLREHLASVAGLASEFSSKFDASAWGHLAGLWHDLGKYRGGFQTYIRQANGVDAHIEGRVGGRDKTHSAAGALWAQEHLQSIAEKHGAAAARVLSYLIAGHHAGLDNWFGGLNDRLNSTDARREFAEAVEAQPPGDILRPGCPSPALAAMPVDDRDGRPPGAFALWTRMLFSCLVDADFLDTERFFDGVVTDARQGFPSLGALNDLLDRHLADKLNALRAQGEDDSPVNRFRADVLRQCREKAAFAPGVFTLTVPTGGGKTLSSLAFALRHVVAHGKRRVIYAIPYTSIIEQTAKIFRDIVGDDNVVEHHSNVESGDSEETHRSRLACENWDAPLVVTTNVQLFESLLARKTSRCRKLHNIVGSVIVLDEAQLLPVEFLQPILDVLGLLVRDYGVTVLFCTATQPALTKRDSFDPTHRMRGFDESKVTEIIDDVPSLYAGLKRVRVYSPPNLDSPQNWAAIGKEIARHDAVLVIVNRRKDAADLYRLLSSDHAEGLYHLSALMCAQHRTEILARVRCALDQRRALGMKGQTAYPVRVVSTQLVEAGVDLDFPVVYRAMAGLDSIAQAAGRCNREGRLDTGTMHVFIPPTQPPPGLLRQAAIECTVLWKQLPADADPIDLALFPSYFRRLYSQDLDKKRICEALRVGRDGDVRFRDAAEWFRLIDDKDGVPVVIRYAGDGDASQVNARIGMLEAEGPHRWLMRKLQRYTVTIYRHDAERLLRQGDIRCAERCPGLYIQASDVLYDNRLGLLTDGAPGDPAAYVS